MPMMPAAKAPAATTSRRAPIGMLGIFRAPYAAMHPAASAGATHGSGSRSRHMRAAAFAAVGIVVATLCWAYAAIQPASTQRLAASAPSAQQHQAAPPDWLNAVSSRKDSERSLRADGAGTEDSGAAGGAAAAPLHPELAGVLGDWRQRAAAIRRMRRWEHGLGAHQPLPPKAMMEAAAALFAAGGRLQGLNAATGIGTDAGGALGPAALGLQSYYAPWILADLAHWSHSGISQEMVDEAAAARRKCQGSGMRVVVQNGTVWVDHLSPRPPKGWYPATLGPGWVSSKGRVPYIVLSLMDVIREYGNEVPDVDIVLGCGDSPCSKLPSPKRPAAGRRRQRRRLHASMTDDRMRHGHAASAGGGGNGSHNAGHCGGHGSSGSRGQPEVDDFGTLLPAFRCGGGEVKDSSSADGAAEGRPSLSAGAGVGSSTGGRSSGVHSTVSGGGGGGGGGGTQPAGGSQQRRALAEDPAEPEPPPPPLPMFMYDTRESHADIPFPDFSYWGHEMDRLWEGKDKFVVGWDVQQPMLAKLSRSRPWQRRKPQITWRGRHGPGRDQLRQDYIMCRERLLNDSRVADADLFNFWWPDVALPQLSLYRYNVYIESGAWATNFKQKLASGSPVFAIDPRAPEFFSRALRPGVHYAPLRVADMCNQTVATIRAMNRNWDRLHGGATFFDPLSLLPSWSLWRPASSAGGAKSSSSPGADADSPDPVGSGSSKPGRPGAGKGGKGGNGSTKAAAGGAAAHRRLLALPDHQAALSISGCSGYSRSDNSRRRSGGRKLLGPAELAAAQAAADADISLPTEMAAAAQAFLEKRLRMGDVRRYLLDVLRLYASLQTFQVQPPEQAVCYDGDALLGQFGTPYPADAEVVAGKYPWLEGFDAGACPRDRLPKDGWQTAASQKNPKKGFLRRWVH